MSTERFIQYGLALAFVTALVSAFLIRTPRLPVDAPRVTLQVHPLPPGTRFANVEAIEHGGVSVETSAAPLRVRVHERIFVKGWAVDPATGAPPHRIAVRIDEGPIAWAVPDRWRPDVAAALADPIGATSGYVVSIVAAAPGRHRLRTFMSSRGTLIVASPPVELDVAP